MQTQPATRFSSDKQHSSYGIYNWFKIKGIFDQEVMKETMANFCIKNGKKIDIETKEGTLISFCRLKFQPFTAFAIHFLKENNYL